MRPPRRRGRVALAGLGVLGLAALLLGTRTPHEPTEYTVSRGSGCTADYPECGLDEPGREFDDVDACARILRPGDVCWIKDGVYTRGIDDSRDTPYEPRRSGRPDAPLVFAAYPGHRPVFRHGGNWELGMSRRAHHVTYRGLVVEGAIRIQGRSESKRVRGIRIEDCEITGGGGKNDGNWSGIFVQWAEDVTIRNNRIHHVRTDGASKGISIFNGRRVVVEHNHIHDNPSEGIFDKEGGEDNVYRRNVFESNGVHLKVNNQSDERGIFNVGTQIYENLFLCDAGGGSSSILMLSRPTRWKAYNNTGYECAGIEVRSNSGAANAEAVYNNIWWRSEAGRSMWTSQAGDDREPDYMDFNLYAIDGRFRENRYSESARKLRGLAAWQSAEHPRRYDLHSLEADPLFVDPAARNFRLRPDSPARGAGRDGEDLGAWPRDDDTVVGTLDPPPAVSAAPPSPARGCTRTEADRVFCEDFEAGELDRRRWRDVKLGGDGAVLRVQERVAASGRFAAEGRSVSGRRTDLWAAAGFGDHPLWSRGPRLEEITVRAQLRWSEGFAFERSAGAKILIVGAFEGWSAGYPGPNAWSPYYVLLQWRRADRGDRPRELEAVLHRKTECRGPGAAHDCNAWRALPANRASVPIEPGRWYQVALHLALNAPGRADGVLEAQVDGTPVLAYRDLDVRGRYARYGLNQLMMSRRAGARSPTQSLFWDDLSVRAGAEAFAASPAPDPRVPPQSGR